MGCRGTRVRHCRALLVAAKKSLPFGERRPDLHDASSGTAVVKVVAGVSTLFSPESAPSPGWLKGRVHAGLSYVRKQTRQLVQGWPLDALYRGPHMYVRCQTLDNVGHGPHASLVRGGADFSLGSDGKFCDVSKFSYHFVLHSRFRGQRHDHMAMVM